MNLRRMTAALPLAAALVVGGTAVSASADTATPTDRPATSTSDVGTMEEWVHIGDYFWETDCVDKGTEMLESGSITKFNCDGSPSPTDEYSLFVVWG